MFYHLSKILNSKSFYCNWKHPISYFKNFVQLTYFQNFGLTRRLVYRSGCQQHRPNCSQSFENSYPTIWSASTQPIRLKLNRLQCPTIWKYSAVLILSQRTGDVGILFYLARMTLTRLFHSPHNNLKLAGDKSGRTGTRIVYETGFLFFCFSSAS